MINVLPMTIESLVAILLLLTILYCVRLNNQLRRLKSDETSMRTIITELVGAVDAAERAIAMLKLTVHDTEQSLAESLKSAEHFNGELNRNTAASAEVLNRLTQIAGARPWLMGVATGNAGQRYPEFGPKPGPKPELKTRAATPDPEAIAAAARAFTERARARSKVNAA